MFKDYDNVLSYSGGEVTNVDWVNGELMSFFDLEDIVYELGYREKMELFYKYPGRQAFKKIEDNHEMLEMFGVYRRMRSINVYICQCDPVALNVLHLGDEDYCDMGEGSDAFEFGEE